jgi:anti-anti-sigma regulatory factor
MVFSFFKKPPEKMIIRPAAVPRPEDKQAPVAEQASDKDLLKASLTEFSDSEFTQSSLDFQVDGDFDPINASAEEAAVLFANSQDQAAQTILENARGLPEWQQSGPAERLWLMLFDLYRLSGQQSAFEAMGIDYACAFEKSPPSWGAGSESEDLARMSKGKGGGMLFKGNLLGSNVSSFDAMRQALGKNPALRLDMSKVKQVDVEGCACLLKLLLSARNSRCEIDLLGRDVLVPLVKERIEAGKRETPVAGKACWLLLLELFQQQGPQEVFEELAIDYAVTFEESPPSWEIRRVAKPDVVAREVAVESVAADDGVYALGGEIRSSRFANLLAFAEIQDSLLIDCGKLTRIDFISAGALLNTLMTVRNTGKQVVFRHPNYLVAELFRVVGLTSVATVVFAKQ